MTDWLRALPKVELHVHLEGAIRPETVLHLFRRHGNREVTSPRQVRELFVHRHFREFLNHYKTICQWLRDPEDLERVTREFLRDLAAQNVRYVEATVSPGALRALAGWEPERVLEAVRRGYLQVHGELGLEMALLVDLVRNLGPEEGWRMVRLAARWRDRGVVGITLGGNERDFPAAPYADIYRWARDQGLRTTAHAGEWAGPESVWDCLRLLQVERIGHGVRACEDPALVDHLVERQVPLECCPTSNVATGVVRAWEEHPVGDLHRRGVRLGINSDDPTLFGTTLTRELELLHRVHGFGEEDLARVLRQSIEMAFLPEERKQLLARELEEHLGRGPVEGEGAAEREAGEMERAARRVTDEG